jgi:hypothetical protein
MLMWGEVYCPSCETRNFIRLGEMSSGDSIEVEAVRCWSCQNEFWVNEEGLDEDELNDLGSITDSYIEEGVELPE